MQFSQASIEIENQAVVAELKCAIENALITRPDEFLLLVKRFGLHVRSFEEILNERGFEQLPGTISSQPSGELYRKLSPSDQGLVREFYLTKVEEVPVELRAKYLKLFRYQ
jgi:hypothetical protein